MQYLATIFIIGLVILGKVCLFRIY